MTTVSSAVVTPSPIANGTTDRPDLISQKGTDPANSESTGGILVPLAGIKGTGGGVKKPPYRRSKENVTLNRTNSSNGSDNVAFWNTNGSFRMSAPAPGNHRSIPFYHTHHQHRQAPNGTATRPILDMRHKAAAAYFASCYLAYGATTKYPPSVGNHNANRYPWQHQYNGPNYIPIPGVNISGTGAGSETRYTSWQGKSNYGKNLSTISPNLVSAPPKTTYYTGPGSAVRGGWMAATTNTPNGVLGIGIKGQDYTYPASLLFNNGESYSGNKLVGEGRERWADNSFYNYSRHYGLDGWNNNGGQKFVGGTGGVNGIYYIKNNYGDINNHVNNNNNDGLIIPQVPGATGTVGVKRGGISGDTVYFTMPPLPSSTGSLGITLPQANNGNALAVAPKAPGQPSLFLNPKGETYKLVSVNGTSYVVPCSPTDPGTTGTGTGLYPPTLNQLNNNFGPSTTLYERYKAPKVGPVQASAVIKGKFSQIQMKPFDSVPNFGNSFPQVHKKNGQKRIDDDGDDDKNMKSSLLTSPQPPPSADGCGKIKFSHDSGAAPGEKKPNDNFNSTLFHEGCRKSATNKNMVVEEKRVLKFSDIALNDEDNLKDIIKDDQNENQGFIKSEVDDKSLGGIPNSSHTSLLEELKMAMDYPETAVETGDQLLSAKGPRVGKLYPEWNGSAKLSSDKDANFQDAPPSSPKSDQTIKREQPLSESFKPKSVEDLNMSLMNTPIKQQPLRTNTVCCRLM